MPVRCCEALRAIVLGTTDGLYYRCEAPGAKRGGRRLWVLTNFKLFTQSVGINDKQGALTKAINKTDRVVLDYKNKCFRLNLPRSIFVMPVKIATPINDGFDRDWREIGGAREAQYTNLSPGEYVFKVRACNNDGVWTQDAKQIVVIQLPPPWKNLVGL